MNLGSLADVALDRSVVGGYSRLGYRIRSQGWSGDPAPHALRGRTALVTGASSGIGKAIAAGLAALGATVVMVSRSLERVDAARAELAAKHPDAQFRAIPCDVADLSAVRKFAADFTTGPCHLDVIIHNAGVLPAERTETADGHEITLATHILGPMLMTELLLPTLAASSDPRVILMSSGGMYTQALNAQDPEYRSGPYRGATAYARTKRMQVALTPLMAQRWQGVGVSVYCMHPGWSDTPGVTTSLPTFAKLTKSLLRTPEQGADTAIWLAATQPPPPSGQFFHDRRQRPEHYLPFTHDSPAERDRLWAYCTQALGLSR